MGDNLMSEINVDTIKDAAGLREFFPCTAWVNFNGTGTVAIRDSGNVSSITDNAVGDYTVNFNVAMMNADYSIGGQSGVNIVNNISTGMGINSIDGSGYLTTNSVRVASGSKSNGSLMDVELIFIQIFGGS